MINNSNCNSNNPPVNGIHICHSYPADTVSTPTSYLTHTVAAALSPPLLFTLHTQLPLHCLHAYFLPYTHSCRCIVSTPTSSYLTHTVAAALSPPPSSYLTHTVAAALSPPPTSYLTHTVATALSPRLFLTLHT